MFFPFRFLYLRCTGIISVVFHAFVSFFSAHTLSHPISWCNNAIGAMPRRVASRRHYPRKLKWRVCVGHRRWVISTNVVRDLHGGGICETAITIIGDLQRAYDDDSPRTYFVNTSIILHQLSLLSVILFSMSSRSESLQSLDFYKNDFFVKISKNLIRYRSENNFVRTIKIIL